MWLGDLCSAAECVLAPCEGKEEGRSAAVGDEIRLLSDDHPTMPFAVREVPTSDAVLIVHGGDLAAARARFPAAPLPWVDLSTGLHPRGYPVGDLPEEIWRRLPDRAALGALETAAAASYRAGQLARVVAAPGTQALIQLLPRLLPARRVAVLGFGYEEHPAVWRASGALVRRVDTLAELARADVAVVVSPNNPDGRTLGPDILLTLAGQLAAHGGTLVLDEAFADTRDPAFSVVPRLPAAGIVVLRSFGKFFGLAGVRLGFAVTGDALAGPLRAALGPWAVSGPALAIGTRALADTAWQQRERTRLVTDAARLDALLTRSGLAVLGGTSLFRLAGTSDAAGIAERLGRAGVLVREFPARPEWLRFGLPDGQDAWDRLAAALRA